MLKGRALLTQNCTRVTVEKLGLKNNVGQLWGDVKCKKTAPRLDDLKYVVSKLSSVDRKIHNTNVQTTRQSNTAHILSHYLHFIT